MCRYMDTKGISSVFRVTCIYNVYIWDTSKSQKRLKNRL